MTIKAWQMNEAERQRSIARHNEAAALRHAVEVERSVWLGVVSQKDAALIQKDTELIQKDTALIQKDAALMQKDAVIAEKDAFIKELLSRLDESK